MASAFVETVTTVPLAASAEPGDAYAAWRDGGFAAHKFLASKLSRKTYVALLAVLYELVVRSQARYPDLYAVLKFVPKKNGLNPLLAQLAQQPDPALAAASLGISGLKPREVRRKIHDLQRALEQSWLLFSAYLTLPSRPQREDFLWSARTIVEKVKTDQRSRSLELLCIAAFGRDSLLYPLVATRPLRTTFEMSFNQDTWHPKPTNARMVWQRSRMVYPFLELAHRAWRSREAVVAAAAEEEDAAAAETAAAEVGVLLDNIARASPEEKVLNSLLYWLLDISFKAMLAGEVIEAWTVEPYILRRAGVELKLVAELEKLGHLLRLLSRASGGEGTDTDQITDGLGKGAALLLEVKEVGDVHTPLPHTAPS